MLVMSCMVEFITVPGWKSAYWRKDAWRTLAADTTRCHADEFPMGDVAEAQFEGQVIRLVSGNANVRHSLSSHTVSTDKT
jgi:hypothetical protein